MQATNPTSKPQRRVIRVPLRARIMLLFAVLYALAYFALISYVHELATRVVNEAIAGALPKDASPEVAINIAKSVIAQVSAAEIPVFIVSFLFLMLALFFASYGITRPLRALTRYAERISAGDYSPAHIPQISFVSDEITTLSQVFDIMVSKVREREQTLKTQVKELQISIDQVLKTKQVEEIVDSEFFAKLKDQVRDMKTRPRPEATTAASDNVSTREA